MHRLAGVVPLPRSFVAELDRLGISVTEDLALAKRTWWRVGGCADGFVTLESVRDVEAVVRLSAAMGVPLWMLGNGSNVLVSDAGVRGVVVRLGGALAEIDAAGDVPVLTVGGGANLVLLTGRAGRCGWTGIEFFAGIPGTLGGAVRMNAGTSLGEVVDALVDVELVTPEGAGWVPASSLGLSYRHSELPAHSVVVSARLRTTGGDAGHSRRIVAEHLERRARTQPVDVPTCGSTFRNPPGDYAGRLVESVGLKGLVRGRARVSPKHANFVENLGEASASEIWELIEVVRDAVLSQHGILLEPEVQRCGAW